MRRDMDLVRKILLEIEASEDHPDMMSLIGVEPHEKHEVESDIREKYGYHIKMLVQQARLLTGIDATSMSGPDWLDLQLTWSGHDFLENTRNAKVWGKTKAAIEKVGGAGWDVVVGLAKEYAKQEIKEKLGVSF